MSSSTGATHTTGITTGNDVVDHLVAASAPVATAIVRVPSADEHRPHNLDAMVDRAVRSVESAGGTPDMVTALRTALEQTAGDADPGSSLGVVVDAEGAHVAPFVAGHDEVTSVGSLPRFVPFLRDRFDHRPHVVVRVDRTGAEIARVVRGEVLSDREVSGDELHVQKIHSGGWSHARLQRHAEHTWEQNAKEVVQAVVAAADDIAAELVVVTGDLRAVGLVRDHLPERLADLAVFDDLEPSDADDEARVFARAATLVADRAASEVVAVLERFAEARGRDEAVADSTEAVLTALGRGAVEILLVGDDVDDEVVVAQDDPMQVATSSESLADLGLARIVPARLTDAAVSAALAGGAHVVVVPTNGPHGPSGPLGALLRY